MKPEDVTLLIVEDDEELREALIFDYEQVGFRVISASNGKIAFDIMKTQKVDIILSDIRMPGGDGVELLKKIRQLNPDIPILMFITGFSDITPQEAIKLGAHKVFEKPFNRQVILSEIYKAIDLLVGMQSLAGGTSL
ncbi:MAG: response regulator [Oligoflexia bacterium]|nr:response regulator [Oligoflexia bacterium]